MVEIVHSYTSAWEWALARYPAFGPVGHYNLLDLAFHCPNFTTLSILPYGWVCLDADPHVASFGLTTGKRTVSYAEGIDQ